MPWSQHTARGARRLCAYLTLIAIVAAVQSPAANAAPEAVAHFLPPSGKKRPTGVTRSAQTRDSDRDGLSNWTELKRTRTNPNRRDTDHDGLGDGTEVKRTKTDPRRRDTDGDGVPDGTEVRAGSNPRDPANVPERPFELPAPLALPSPAEEPEEEAEPPPPPPPDTTPPDTQIGTKPAPLVNSASASFSFTGSDPGDSGVASFQCKLDSGSLTPCTSPRDLTGLAEGAHSFEVRAIDAAGNTDPTPASFAWTVDLTPPSLSIGSGPDGLTNDPTPTFAFSAEAGAMLACSIDQGSPSFGPCSAASSHTPAGPLGEGGHTFRARATDAAGNQAVATRSFTVDTAAPPAPELSATVPPSPANDNTPLVTGSAPAGSTVRLYVGACTGSPTATVGASALAAGVEVGAPDDSTTVFRATATTAANNTSGCSEPLAYLEDSTAPNTQITAQPAALVKTATASFSFTGNDPGGSGVASIQCKLDGGSFVSCTSPQDYSGLADGAHSFQVRAIDAAGNVDAAPASHTWTIDTTPPSVSIDSGPTGLTGDSTPTFAFSAAAATFECSVDKGTPAFGPCSAAGSHTPSPALADGAWTFRVRATDAATNQATATRGITVDATAPDTQIGAKPATLTNSAAASFSFTGNDGTGSGVASFQCKVDGGSFAPCTSPKDYAGLTEGSHSFEVRAIDAAGNTDGAPATHSWTVDTVAPDTQITNQPPALTSSTGASFSFTGSDLGGSGVTSFQCKLDGGSFTACASAHNLSGLGEGSHSFEVRAIDQAGNTDGSPATHTWTVDLTPPSVQVDSGPSGLTNDSTPTFAFSASGATFECSVDTGTPAFGPCSSAGSHMPASPLADGPRTFRVRATDAAGNQATATRAFTVDATPPDTQIGTKPESLVNSTLASFSFTGSDGSGSGAASFQCKLDSGGFAACTSPHEYTSLAEGPHNFEVRAIDQAGNADQSPAAHEWQVDTVPPSLSIVLGPDGLTNDPTPIFSFDTEGGASVACSIDKGAASFGACSAAGTHTPSPPLADDAWTFRVRATDTAGNQATATRGFTVDTAAPPAPVLSATDPTSPADENDPVIFGSAPAGATVRLYTGGSCAGAPIATVSTAALEAGVQATVSNDSTTTFRATATTVAGNTSGCSEPLAYVEDSTAPATEITAQPGALVNSTSASFSFTGNDGSGSSVASFQCKVDSGSFTACTSPRDYTSLAEGSHSFEVRAIDKAGNRDATPAGFTWTVDTTPPAVQIDSGPTGLTSDSTPTFAFSAPGASFECSVDKGAPAFGPCSATGSHTPSPALADGAWTFRVRASDAATNQATATRGFTVDATAPETQIDTKPATPTNATAASFSFTGNDGTGSGVASFQCKVDGGSFGACTSVHNLSGLGEGSHSFEVRAIDAAGNLDATPAVHAWTVDLTPPSVQVDSGPSGLTNDSTPTFGFSAPGATLACSIDKGSPIFNPCSGAGAHTPSPALADGAWTFRVRATDSAGNQAVATRSFTIDATAPETQITAQPTALTNAAAAAFSFAGSDPGGSGVASYQCRLDSGSFSACTSAHEYTALADGPHTFEVRAIDQAGSADPDPATFTWTIDTKPPDTQITAQPTTLTNATAASFSFTGSDPGGSGVASYQCRLDSGAFTACTSPRDYTSLGEGSHKFEVRAIDAAGNVDAAPASHTWTVDTTPPSVSIDSGPTGLTSDSTPTFAFSAAGATFECSVDKGTPAFGPCSATGSHTPSPALADGAWTFRVRATDAATNQATATRGITVDATAPDTQIETKPATLTNSAAASFSFTGSDGSGSGVASFQCKLDSGSFSACPSPRDYTSLAEGSHSFEVRAIDAAGNLDATPAAHTWTVDTTPPTVSIDSGPTGLTSDSTPTFVFSAAGASFECSVDTGTPSFGPCSGASSHTPASPLPDGPRTFRVRAADPAGNQAITTRGFTVDSTAPDTQITAQPAALVKATTASFSFTGNDGSGSGVVSFQCKLNAGAFTTCTSAHEYTSLGEGSHKFEVRAIDAAGNVDAAPASHTWTIDTTPPAVQIDSGPTSLTSDSTPTFVFSAPGASFECSVDKGTPAFGPCSATGSHTPSPALADGAWTFRVRASDAATNQATATRGFTVDATAPETQIDTKPAALVNSAAASFSFTGNDGSGAGIASFECRLDSGAFTACSSPRDYTSLAEGSHSFEVRAIDQAGNLDATPAVHTWTVDLTPPSVSIDSGPTGFTANPSPTFAFSAPGASFECSVDTGTPSFGPCSGASSHTPASPLPDGPRTFRVRAADPAGNQAVATRGFTVDATAPETQIGTKPATLTNATAASFSFTGNDGSGSGVASFQCKLDSGPFSACTSAHNLSGLGEGSHNFEVRAIDAAGNLDATPAAHAWTVDLTPPAVQIDSGPAGLTSDSTPTFAFSASGATFQCSVDKGTPAFGTCSGAGTHTPAAPLADGAWTFRVRATDAAANQATATRGFTVDATAPETQITAKPAALVNGAAASFSFTGNDGSGSGIASFQCRLDAGAWAPCVSPQGYAGLADGPHEFEARSLDAAGNADQSPATHAWTVDTTPPALSIDSGPDGLTNDPTPAFGFGSEPGASFQCSIDKGTPAFGSCSGLSSHTPSPALADGAWTFRVRATDAATNQATATRGFEVDTAAPPAPELSSTVPPSPADENDPVIFGSAPAAATVRLYMGGHCSGAPLATISPAQLGTGVTVAVPDDSSTVFRATSTTAAANTSGCSEPLVYVEDSSAPETQITAQPAALVKAATASFSFTGSDPGSSGVASFQCKLDGGSFGPCTSPKDYAGLGEGAHGFEVRAIDAAGNVDAVPAAHTWTVDTVAPVVTIDSVSKAVLKAGDTSAITWHAGENGAFELRLGNSCDAGAVLDSGIYGTTPATKVSSVTAAQLAEGLNTLRLCLTDAAGNRGSAATTLRRDTMAPGTQVTAQPPALTNSTGATFAFTGSDSGGSGVASFSCRLDGGSFAPCTSPREYTGLSEGPHVFEVSATDQAGNSDQSPVEIEWQIDLTPPTVSIERGPDGLTSNPTPTFVFSSPGAGFACSLDQGTPAFSPCSAASSHTPATPLAEGAYTFRVRATDAAGNQATATRGFEVNPTLPPAPDLSATVPASPANHNQPLIFGTAQGDTTVRLYTGGTCSGAPIATLDPDALAEGVEVGVPDDSTTVFRATATTVAESTSGCSEPLVYAEDSTAPETTLGSPPPATTHSTSATFFLTTSEPSTSLQCALDGAPLESCGSPRSHANLAPGAHSFTARATDAAGNVDPTPVTWAWTIEPPPSVAPSACVVGAVQATTAAAILAAVQAGEDVCVTAEVGTVDLRNLGSRPVVISTDGGSMGDVNILSTTDLTISGARLRSVEMRNAHRTMLLDNVIGGTQAARVPDQLIFMPGESDDVVIEGNDVGWTVADDSGNTGYGCRCYGDLDRLRFVGNRLHDLAADGFQGIGGVDVVIDRNEIGPVGRNPESNEHTDNIQITGNDANLRITNNWIHHQGYYEGGVTANAGSTYIHGGSTGSLVYENNLIESTQGRTEICGLGTGGVERSNLTVRRNTWVDGGQAFTSFPGFEWDCDSGSGNTITRNIAIDPDGGLADNGYDAALVAPNLFGNPSLVTLDASRSCTSANCNPAGEEPIGYRKPSGVEW